MKFPPKYTKSDYNFSNLRIAYGIAFYLIFYPPIHELGHIFVALLQGRTVYSAIFFGMNAITYSTSYTDPWANLWFYLAGIATIPIFFGIIFRGVFKKFIPYEIYLYFTIEFFSILTSTDLSKAIHCIFQILHMA